jgi:hypothetical protein
MIEEYNTAKAQLEHMKTACEMARKVNLEVATNMKFGVLPRFEEKVCEVEEKIGVLIKEHHILLNASRDNNYVELVFMRNGCIKIFKLSHDSCGDISSQSWCLYRSKAKQHRYFENDENDFDIVQQHDKDGFFWSIDAFNANYNRIETNLKFALTPEEGHSLYKQIKEWQNDIKAENIAKNSLERCSINYIYF